MLIVEAWILLGMASGKAELPYWESYRSGGSTVRPVDRKEELVKGTYKATGIHAVFNGCINRRWVRARALFRKEDDSDLLLLDRRLLCLVDMLPLRRG